MGKKRGGRRLNKSIVADMVQALFQAHPGETLTTKQIFKALKLDTHPAKMLAVETMDEMLKRARAFLYWVKEHYPDQTVLAVGHGIIKNH